jgi:hypothetical protein
MKKIGCGLIFMGLVQAVCADPAAVVLPYIQINIGDTTYVSSHDGSSGVNALATLAAPNLDTNAITDAQANFASPPDIDFGSGNVYLMSPVATLPQANGKTCIASAKDPLLVTCPMGLTFSDGVSHYQVPVIYYSGLRALSVYELTMARSIAISTQGQPDNHPNLLEISAVPNDFVGASSAKPIPIVDLSQYFAQTDSRTTYTLDASNVNQLATAANFKCNVPLITEANIAATGNHLPACAEADFAIVTQGGVTTLSASHPLASGVYQINIKAAEPNGEAAYQTFYLNINPENPNLVSWWQGQAASTNVLGQYPTIYAYAPTDVGSNNEGVWNNSYDGYLKDVLQINANYLNQTNGLNPIEAVLFEVMTATYPASVNGSIPDPKGRGLPYWPADANGNPNPNWMITDRDSCWFKIGACTTPTHDIAVNGMAPLQYLVNRYADQSIGIMMSFDFDNTVRAQFSSYNPAQRDLLVSTIVDAIAQSYNPQGHSLDGISMDLEGGFDNQGAIQTYKEITDRLAYVGKPFTYFGFPDSFSPEFFAAMGPLGFANFSTYDAGQYRAPQTSPVPIMNMIPYDTNGFWNSADAQDFFENALSNDEQCSTQSNGPNGGLIYAPVSWCSLSSSDSYSENHRRFETPITSTNPKISISPADSIQYYNGKFAMVLPLAATATEWSDLEIWHPDFTTTKRDNQGNSVLSIPPILLDQNSCTIPCSQDPTAACINGRASIVTNGYIQQHVADLSNPQSVLAQCLKNIPFQSTANSTQPVMYQNVSACPGVDGKGQPLSLDQCMLVSSLPGGSVAQSGLIPKNTPATLLPNNMMAYQLDDLGLAQTHVVGYGFFALQNNLTSGGLAAGNVNVGLIPQNQPVFLPTPNALVQEPLYMGWNPPAGPDYPVDPYYSEAGVNQNWSQIVQALKNWYLKNSSS